MIIFPDPDSFASPVFGKSAIVAAVTGFETKKCTVRSANVGLLHHTARRYSILGRDGAAQNDAGGEGNTHETKHEEISSHTCVNNTHSISD